MKTKTGGYPIGSRAFFPDWKPEIEEVISWATESGLECLDVKPDAQTAKKVHQAGLKVGTVDLPGWNSHKGLITNDEQTRNAALEECRVLIESCAAIGPMKYFVVFQPQHPELEPKENFGYLLSFLERLLPILDQCDATLSIEGYPGPGALCCTPEGLRALYRELPSTRLAVNYDPSHLIRVGIDPYRFLQEFGDKVCHVHGKETEFMTERLYELGNYQPALDTPSFHFGGTSWRYTIPGHGCFNWRRCFEILDEKRYQGCVSIELEDMYFCVSEEGDRNGVIQGAHFLQGC